MSLFYQKNIGALLAGLQKQKLTAAEIAEVCIERMEKMEPHCNAWVCTDYDKLRQDAAQADERIAQGKKVRALEAVPVGVKDIMNTREFPTQMGSPLWSNFTPGNDARVVHAMKMEGALIPGKTDTAEFAVHTPGKALNPHNKQVATGTSSSGSAVAVAAGMVPCALATQTAGSIVRPASFCGVYGFKPSFGLIPRTGMLKTTDSLDTVGFFSLHAADMKRIFDIVRVNGFDYPFSHAALSDKPRQNKPSSRPWKIAVVKTHVWDHAEEYAKEALMAFAEKLKGIAGIELLEQDLPECMSKAHKVHADIYNRTLAYYFQEEFKKSELVSPIMNRLIENGQQISVERYQAALHEQEDLAREMDRYMSQYDAIISLSTAGHAPAVGVEEKPDPALMWTMTWLPVISAPVFISNTGLPFGAQLVARRYNDYLLLSLVEFLTEKELVPPMAHPVLQA